MIVVVVLAALIASVPCTGGRLRDLAQLDLRRPWLIVAGFAAQTAAVSVAPTMPAGLASALHVASYAVAGVFLLGNLHVRWMWVIGLGGALNGVAIAANGGVMPASAAAYRTAGLDAATGGFVNSRPVAQPRVLALGDVFAVPARWPFANVFSVGDVVLAIGAGLVLHAACRPLAARSTAAEPGSTLRACR